MSRAYIVESCIVVVLLSHSRKYALHNSCRPTTIRRTIKAWNKVCTELRKCSRFLSLANFGHKCLWHNEHPGLTRPEIGISSNQALLKYKTTKLNFPIVGTDWTQSELYIHTGSPPMLITPWFTGCDYRTHSWGSLSISRCVCTHSSIHSVPPYRECVTFSPNPHSSRVHRYWCNPPSDFLHLSSIEWKLSWNESDCKL